MFRLDQILQKKYKKNNEKTRQIQRLMSGTLRDKDTLAPTFKVPTKNRKGKVFQKYVQVSPIVVV